MSSPTSPTGTRPAGTRSAETRPAETRPAGTRPIGALRRLSAATAIGALVGLPLAVHASATGPASVTFTGGSAGDLCESKPDVAQISVQAEQKVRLTNQIGLDATLNIDGSAGSTVTDGETVEVQFHRGPVTLGMVPDCPPGLEQRFEQLTVEVRQNPADARPSAPATTPRPSTKPSATSPSGGHGPDNGSPPLPPAAGEPLFSEAATPGADASAGVNLDAPVTVVHPSRSPNGQSLAGDTGRVDKRLIGLLAIIAIVCVVGVSAGAIRAIITQRATWVEFA
jgi:hypothetical protein